jgi:N-acetyl-gamma-glutamyl-phosphate reductase
MIQVAIAGASGYTGLELLRILLRHPEVTITAVTSEQHDGKPVNEVFPGLVDAGGLICRSLKTADLAKRADVVFTALPHGTAMQTVAEVVDAGRRAIDISADYRLRPRHPREDLRRHARGPICWQAVYGLPELHREAIRGAELVANPGCVTRRAPSSRWRRSCARG